MENPNVDSHVWTTTKDKTNRIAYFVFHTFGKYHGFYDWWATLDVHEQDKVREDVASIIRSVNGSGE